jgi:hypothetical protein
MSTFPALSTVVIGWRTPYYRIYARTAEIPVVRNEVVINRRESLRQVSTCIADDRSGVALLT